MKLSTKCQAGVELAVRRTDGTRAGISDRGLLSADVSGRLIAACVIETRTNPFFSVVESRANALCFAQEAPFRLTQVRSPFPSTVERFR